MIFSNPNPLKVVNGYYLFQMIGQCNLSKISGIIRVGKLFIIYNFESVNLH